MKSLEEIRRAELEEYVFPGTDALVIVIERMLAQEDVQEIFREIGGQHRLYQTDVGWKVKFPHADVAGMLDEDSFSSPGVSVVREEKGWDHEHCSFCDEHVFIGDTCHTAPHESGGVYVLCLKCAGKCG
jgi:hypothetical protein